jgi:hypothetical protein
MVVGMQGKSELSWGAGRVGLGFVLVIWSGDVVEDTRQNALALARSLVRGA